MKIREADIAIEAQVIETFLNDQWDAAAAGDDWRYRIPTKPVQKTAICVEDAQKIVGIGLWLFLTAKDGPDVMLDRVVVDMNRRREGIASHLLLEFTERMDAQALSSTLRVDRARGELIRLYEGFGFSVCDGELESAGVYIFMDRPSITSPL